MYCISRFQKLLAITLITLTIVAGSLVYATSGTLNGTGLQVQSDAAVSYTLLDQPGGSAAYRLQVTVPAELINYYAKLSHTVLLPADYAKYVTPQTVQPIADTLRQAYPADEDFANAVLQLVQQIPYQETSGSYYAVETLARNSADCDVTSALAASILKAGGLDAVLLDYPSDNHMNVGVHLAEPPTQAHQTVTPIEYQGKMYYVGETTSSNWQNSWRIGENPPTLGSANVLPIASNSAAAVPSEMRAELVSLA